MAEQGTVASQQVIDRVRALLAEAIRAYWGRPAQATLGALAIRLDEPLRVALVGRSNAGKSTLLNALVGERMAPTDASECTRVVTWYEDGLSYRAQLHKRDGTSHDASLVRVRGSITVDTAGVAIDELDHIEVEWPSTRLKRMTLIDTPGIGSLSVDSSTRTFDLFDASVVRDDPADAVVYLMRHLQPTDINFLEAFHDDSLVRGSPINAVGVVARIDELGGGRADALELAATVADGYGADPRLKKLCHQIIPIAGLLAEAGLTLTQAEFDALASLATRPDNEPLLLTVDSFAYTDLAGASVAMRRQLLERMGMFGVRLALAALVNGDVTSAEELAAFLVAKSGIDRLHDALTSHLIARRDILKANSALRAMLAVVQSDPIPASGNLSLEADALRATAHEFVELNTLTSLRQVCVDLRPNEMDDAERLLGLHGNDTRTRLGLPDDAPAVDVLRALEAEMTRWRRRGEHPLSSSAVVELCRALVRTCEGLLIAAAPEPVPGS